MQPRVLNFDFKLVLEHFDNSLNRPHLQNYQLLKVQVSALESQP